jgi:hypothetical protein
MKNFSLLTGLLFVILLLTSFTRSNSKSSSLRRFQIEPCDLVGYTCIDCSNVVGDFEGADFDKPIKLDNGMVFEFQEYNYTYSYRPEVAVFYKQLSYGGRNYNLYKLLIEDDIYDVVRIR